MYRAVILGAGNIGGGYDSLEEDNSLSHAKAYKKNSKTQLLGFFDQEKEHAKKQAIKWDVDCFNTMEEAMKESDIVSICTPDETHLQLFERVLSNRPKAIILEKPFGMNLEQAKQMKNMAQDTETKVFLNYPRGYNPKICQIKEDILSGKYGEFINGTGKYGKGLIHNGSHLLHIIEFLTGEQFVPDKILKAYKDGQGIDYNYDFILNGKNGSTFLMTSIPSKFYTIFEWELLFEKARIQFMDSGFSVKTQIKEPNPLFSGYFQLGRERTESTQYHYYMNHVIENVVGVLDGIQEPKVSIREGHRVMELIEMIRS